MMNIQSPFSKLKNKTGKHKDWYGLDYIKILCDEINKQKKHINSKNFLNDYKKEYLKLELKDRLKLIASLIDIYLKKNFKQKIKIFESLLGERWPSEEGMYNHGFFLYPISQFIEEYGHLDPHTSLEFLEKLTMRFTGEWAIRALANDEEKLVLAQMKKWSKHENFHVRRLASEGLRARLPWGRSIEWVKSNPKKTLPIYNKLRNDKSLYVRRSVANSMGDMIKIDEELAYETFLSWLEKKKTPENIWVIKHAIRTPVKKKIKKYLDLKKRLEKITF